MDKVLLEAQIAEIHRAAGNNKPVLSLTAAAKALGISKRQLLADGSFPLRRRASGKGWEAPVVPMAAWCIDRRRC